MGGPPSPAGIPIAADPSRGRKGVFPPPTDRPNRNFRQNSGQKRINLRCKTPEFFLIRVPEPRRPSESFRQGDFLKGPPSPAPSPGTSAGLRKGRGVRPRSACPLILR
ncbi:MAG: hypothetical protein C6P37_07330 [Caldibacillus debilis]|uniref:Uncharacterized protein n=1 Tax=Caldibacillus debilis TaxID=301148 RepID=A0A3E0K5H1_9BACI|nr:MAG: hypothetical protein C6W57_11340 [Caldibacillus debilis]REJ29040.1 MAG: hypothetical protein C6P37_07330 [Caldibacillus debilis]